MQILKGAPVAAAIRDEIKKELEGCETKPCLAIVRVGEKQEDLSYERSALKRMSGVGIETKLFVFPADISMDDFSAEFAAINDDPTIDGILLFRPLPAQLNESQIVKSIAPEKDVDGFRKGSCFKSCTPKGIIDWMEYNNFEFKGKDCCVLGRSKIVGLPLTNMLIEKGATVTCCNSTTPSTWYYTRNADYAFSAVGVPNYFDFSDFQDFCELVVDIGINRDENGKLCGDVNNAGFESSLNDTYVTPVPGGVGLLTRLALMQNTLNAYKIQKMKG